MLTDKKIYWRNDCVVVGVADRMKKILRLADHYYEYHELPVFKQKTNVLRPNALGTC